MEQSRIERSCNRNLLEELVLEILTRLPVKSLLRFRSVCKDWKYLISSHSFRNLHRKRHSSSLPLILTCHGEYDDGGKCNWYLTTFDLYGNVVQQCTLPVSARYLSTKSIPSQSKLLSFVEDSDKGFFSYNPSTQQLFRMPDPPCFSLPGSILQTSIFGYIPSKDVYMLVNLVNKNPHERWVCEILTFYISNDNFQLHYNEWRSIKVTTLINLVFFSAVFVCGAFYCDAVDENDKDCILFFDVETEVFSTFRLPQGVFRSYTLMELKDELYLLKKAEDAEPPTLYLWKLSIDVNGTKSWGLYRNINLQSLGFTKYPAYNKFNWSLFIYRLEYLQCYNESCDVLREMGKLKLENVVPEEGEEYFMPNWNPNIHTNLFTL